MLYDGPWVAERYASVGAFIETHPDEVLTTTKGIVGNGTKWSGVQLFEAMARLRTIKANLRTAFGADAILALPTVATLYSIEQMQDDPVLLNNHHGYYSYFANILDLCAMSVPTQFYPSGMPFGLTLMAPAFEDAAVAGLAHRIVQARQVSLGRKR